MSYTLLDLATILRAFGRGVVFRAPVWALGDGPLTMTHLGDTEGDIVVNTNAVTAGLTTPETTGPAVHELDYVGENPVVEIPLALADPALWALCSPHGSAHAGRSRRSSAAEHTLVIFPEQLFLKDVGSGVIESKVVTVSGGVWSLDGTPFTAAQTALFGNAIWLWRGAFNRPPKRYRGGAGDDRKIIESVSFQTMHHPTMPEGQHLYTVGDPILAGVDVETGS